MRIKYESKTYSYFFLAILLSVGLLFSSNCVNITLFDNVYSQKIDNASSLNSSLNSINNLQDGSSSSQIKQQQQQISKNIPLNHYENRQLGVSLKYPSNFLIDESNSNNTLRQISFYPVNLVSVNPEKYIQWMDVFVQTLGTAQQQQQQQPLSSLSNSNSLSPLLSANNNNNNNNNFLASYSLNLANNIQQGNADITIVGSSTNTTLSGYPAYKLITTSYIGNSAITDVLISTIVNNTIYSIDYQIPSSSSSNYANSLSDASKIIQSFKILSPVSSESTTAEGMAETRQQLSSSSSSASNVISNNKNLNSNLSNSNSALIPLLSSLLSSLKIDDIANNSTNTVNSLKNSISNSLNDALSNPKNVIDKSISGSSSILQNPPPIPLLTSPSDLSSLSSDAVKKTCSIPFVSTVCNEIKNSLDNNNNNNINNIGKTNPSSSNVNNLTNNIAGSGNTTINNNNRLSTTTNDLTGSIGKGGNNIGIGNSINNSKVDNTAIPKNNIDNLLVNHDKNNTLVNILNSLLNTNSTNNSSLSFNKSKPLNDILLLENLIKHLNFSSTISPGPLPPQQPISVNSSSSSSPNPLPRNTN